MYIRKQQLINFPKYLYVLAHLMVKHKIFVYVQRQVVVKISTVLNITYTST